HHFTLVSSSNRLSQHAFLCIDPLFLSFFALFSTVAYAAPVSPQGAPSKRCGWEGCRNAVVSSPPSTGSPDLLNNLLMGLIGLVAGLQAPPVVQLTPGSSSGSSSQPSPVQWSTVNAPPTSTPVTV
ncbi:hypothetical protein BJV78DRAFT_1212894, partial [Lactifluus subvellereus]